MIGISFIKLCALQGLKARLYCYATINISIFPDYHDLCY